MLDNDDTLDDEYNMMEGLVSSFLSTAVFTIIAWWLPFITCDRENSAYLLFLLQRMRLVVSLFF